MFRLLQGLHQEGVIDVSLKLIKLLSFKNAQNV